MISGDYDNDGDLDLFVGGRVTPGQYPLSPSSYLLQNNQGKFVDVTAKHAPEMQKMGMVSDAHFVDYDQDGDLDLIAVGEWMPITVFENQHGQLVNVTQQLDLTNTKGWWFKIAAGDFDRDGDVDFVVGNIGNNNKYYPSIEQPLKLHANDFDQNGSLDIVLSKNNNNKELPIRGRECSATQMPGLLNKFPTFKSFAEADLKSIYPANKLETATTFQAELFNSSLLINNENEGFAVKPLPVQSQLSPITGILVDDFNQDNYLDILYTGNFYGAEVETVRYDAGIGGLLLGNGKMQFTSVNPVSSGFVTTNNARDLVNIKLGKVGKNSVLVSNNQQVIQLFKRSSQEQ